jgi:hypothetical protein
MEQLRKIARICTAHHEKIVLSVMLLLLGIAVWILWQETQHEAEKLRQFETGLVRGKIHGVRDAGAFLAANRALIDEARAQRSLELAGPHNLFNPVKWQRRPDGPLLKVQTSKDAGPDALVISKTRPLYFSITPERVGPEGSCYMAISNEVTGVLPKDRKVYVSSSFINRTNLSSYFLLREIQNPTNNPVWVVELTDPKSDEERSVKIPKDGSYQRIEGWEAELKYPPGSKTFSKLRVGTNYVLRLEGEDYKVVAITEKEVVLSGRLNEQLYTVTQKASP